MVGKFHFRYMILILIISLFLQNTYDPNSTYSGVENPQIIYLVLDNHDVMNLWVSSLNNLHEKQQVTSYTNPGTRLYDYQISADGRFVTFVLYNTNTVPKNEIMLLDLQTLQIQQLTNCTAVRAYCYQFSLRPDGQFVAYYQTSQQGLFMRVIDLRETPHSDEIIDEFHLPPSYIHHALPNWVGDTGYLAYNLFWIPFRFQVYDVENNQSIIALPLGTPSRQPYFSSNGSRYVYYQSEADITPRIIKVRETNNPSVGLSSYFKWDLISEGWIGNRIEDWHPDNNQLLISIQYLRFGTPDMGGLQSDLAIFNTTTGSIEQLTYELDYAAYNASWDHDASHILYQRGDRREVEECFCDQIMIYDVEQQEVTALPIFGYHPLWVGDSDIN